MTSNMECGDLAPLFLGQPGLPDRREPRLARQSGAEAPHSKLICLVDKCLSCNDQAGWTKCYVSCITHVARVAHYLKANGKLPDCVGRVFLVRPMRT